MEVNSYRVEYTNINGKLTLVQHWSNLTEAENSLMRHSKLEADVNNVMYRNERFGTIWASDLKTWR